MKQKVSVALTALSALFLFTACKRDITAPAGNSLTDPRAVTPKTANLNFSSGTPQNFPVSAGVITTPDGGPGSTLFTTPTSVASDGVSRFVWVADWSKNQIFIVGNGVILSTFGTGAAGYQDGPASTAQFNHPDGIAFGPDHNLYIADQNNHRIRMINGSTFAVSTVAGTGVAGFADGTPAVAKFNFPAGIAVDANGTIYVTDAGNNMVRRIINNSSVTRWVGQLTAGSQDGNGSLASFHTPRGIAVAPNGAVYVADQFNNTIRKIVSGNVTTFAGSGQGALTDGTGTATAFFHPSALATDSVGNVYVADQFNAAIRLITPTGIVTTVAGGKTGGSVDGFGANAEFQAPGGITVDPKGNIYIADEAEPAVRQLTFVPAVKTLAGNGTFGQVDGPGATAEIAFPQVITSDRSSNVYVAEEQARIVKIQPNGFVSLLAGTGNVSTTPTDGQGAQVSFRFINGITSDAAGNIYVEDGTSVAGNATEPKTIRKITPSGQTITLAGGNSSTTDVDGTGTQARFASFGSNALTIDQAGNLYLAESDRIRKITPDGVVSTLFMLHLIGSDHLIDLSMDAAGNFYGLGTLTAYKITPAGNASVVYSRPQNVLGLQNLISDSRGNLYIINNATIAKINSGLQITVIAGSQQVDLDGPLLDAQFLLPAFMTINPVTGVMYVSDEFANKVKELSLN